MINHHYMDIFYVITIAIIRGESIWISFNYFFVIDVKDDKKIKIRKKRFVPDLSDEDIRVLTPSKITKES